MRELITIKSYELRMHKERKITPVVKKLGFKEAEEADHEYWANASFERRLENDVFWRCR